MKAFLFTVLLLAISSAQAAQATQSENFTFVCTTENGELSFSDEIFVHVTWPSVNNNANTTSLDIQQSIDELKVGASPKYGDSFKTVEFYFTKLLSKKVEQNRYGCELVTFTREAYNVAVGERGELLFKCTTHSVRNACQ